MTHKKSDIEHMVDQVFYNLVNYTNKAIMDSVDQPITQAAFDRGVDIYLNQPSIVTLLRDLGFTSHTKVTEDKLHKLAEICRVNFSNKQPIELEFTYDQ